MEALSEARAVQRRLRADNAHLRALNAELLAACKGLLREAVILSDNYLQAFEHYRDTDTIQGWDKVRWLRAAGAAKKARAAIAKAEGTT